jgi:hypothetical protein
VIGAWVEVVLEHNNTEAEACLMINILFSRFSYCENGSTIEVKAYLSGRLYVLFLDVLVAWFVCFFWKRKLIKCRPNRVHLRARVRARITHPINLSLLLEIVLKRWIICVTGKTVIILDITGCILNT